MNKNSKVLALKYRPQVFEDLIGQEVIVETLKKLSEKTMIFLKRIQQLVGIRMEIGKLFNLKYFLLPCSLIS